MDVPDDDWDIRSPFSSSAGDDTSRETSTSFSRKKREQHFSWLTPASTNAETKKKKKMENKKNNDGEKKKKKINETKKKDEESDAREKPILEASGRLLGRRRRAKEKRKRMAMMRRRGGGGSEEEDEDEDERKKSAKTEDQRKKKEKNEATTEMTEKQKRKAEKNRARKLRREWKRKKEMEEKNARGGGGGGEKEEEEEDEEEEANGKELPNEEERKEMKRLAKDYVAEKAKKRAKSASTAGGGEKEEEDDGGRSSASGGESSEKEDESSDESEDDVAPQQQPVAKKKLSLIDKMRAKLSGGHFRMLNEQLYTTKGDEALRLVQQNPGVFDAYHEGFREQVKKWPKNPVHKCFEWLQHKPYDTVIADFGCGDAELAKLIGTSKKKVYSLDLETPSHAPFVIACNMAKTPLESNSVDVAVFSLSLMGTDYYKFIEEASRVLKVKGILWIAEVKSRFDGKNGAASVSSFIASLKTAGFDVNPKKVDERDKMFFVLEAVKTKNITGTGGDENIVKNKKKRASGSGGRVFVEWPKLKACEYKKR